MPGRTVELGEESPQMAFGTHHDRGPLQFVDRILPRSNLAKADAVLLCWALKFCQAKFHPNHDRRERFAKTNGLFSRLPVAEVCMRLVAFWTIRYHACSCSRFAHARTFSTLAGSGVTMPGSNSPGQ